MNKMHIFAWGVAVLLILGRVALPLGDQTHPESVFHRMKPGKQVTLLESKSGSGKFQLVDATKSGGDWPEKDKATIQQIKPAYIVLNRNSAHPTDGGREFRIPVSSIEEIRQPDGWRRLSR